MLFKCNKSGRIYDICQINPSGNKKIWVAVDFKSGRRNQMDNVDFRFYTPIVQPQKQATFR